MGRFSATLWAIFSPITVIFLLCAGWLVRDRHYVQAEDGLGYALGIIGGSMMLALLVYPLRKRVAAMRYLGGVRPWFRLHMWLGVIGPVAILFHSNFSLGSTNSTVALFCMILVATSGLIGRYLYGRIHVGLYGRRISMRELGQVIEQSRGKLTHAAAASAEITACVDAVDAVVDDDSSKVGQYWRRRSQLRSLRRRLFAAIAAGEDDANNRSRKLRLDAARFIARSGSVVRFQLYEGLFGLWHVFHLPLFAMLVVTGIVHVFAVHVY